ncbi:hypothetical protein [Streptomyces sp. NBRC 110465]|uniref:hypothetical protein n=1 Tax=Streptomyces sp. NBRC 110465 TaxID=1897621 RepID=UPI000933C3D5|nr:hypothetical protein [Streptomyces sp. NBRC 110465]
MTQHIVQYSGGIGSWAAAMRVAERHGVDDLVLLVADSRAEDEDLWRFIEETARYLTVEPVIVADGRDPWQVFHDVRFLGNSRLAPCSVHLKQLPCRRWVEANVDPDDSILYVGFDHTEIRRIPGTTRGWAPWRVEFPMCEEPTMSKEQMLQWARDIGIDPPRLYAWADHNNCAGMCVRGGQKHWAKLLEHEPQRYAEAERREARLRAHLGKDVAILRERRGGVSRPLTLAEHRQRLQAQKAGGRVERTMVRAA